MQLVEYKQTLPFFSLNQTPTPIELTQVRHRQEYINKKIHNITGAEEKQYRVAAVIAKTCALRSGWLLLMETQTFIRTNERSV